jgi:hypothetical protein
MVVYLIARTMVSDALAPFLLSMAVIEFFAEFSLCCYLHNAGRKKSN